MIFMFEKVGASESYMLNFSREGFEEIPLIQSCRELNDVSCEMRLKSLKCELSETLEGHEEVHFTWRTH